MTINDLKDFIDYLDKKDFSEIKVVFDNIKVYINKSKQINSALISEIDPNSEINNNKTELIEIKSPMVGIFYRKSDPQSKNFVELGDTIKKDTKICIIESMKVFNILESNHEGIIEKILIEDSQPVEYGQTLFILRKI